MSSSVSVSSMPARERIVLLDVLRGFAILGMALVNVPFFGVPIARLIDWQWAQVSFSDGLVRCVVAFLADEKFLPIFAMLFGMGLALQNQRVQEAGNNFTKLFVRRLLILFGLGIAHGILIWYGDILALYAFLGFIVFWLRNRSSRTLLVCALVVFMVPMFIQVFLGLGDSGGRGNSFEEKKKAILAELRKQAGGSETGVSGQGLAPAKGRKTASEQKTANAQALIRLIDFMADDQRIYSTGTMRQMILHRSIFYLFFAPLVAFTYMVWKVLGSMLLGLYLYRRGFFCGTDTPPGRYRRLMVFGLVPGVVLQTAGLIIQALNTHHAWAYNLQFGCDYLGKLGMSLGYMGMVALLYQHSRWQSRFEPLAATGRMSLTNYIGTSVLAGLIFYGYGFGLMGRVSFPLVELIALLIVTFLVGFSVVWMKYFLYGPLEWLWRCLTYLRVLPILRGTQPAFQVTTVSG